MKSYLKIDCAGIYSHKIVYKIKRSQQRADEKPKNLSTGPLFQHRSVWEALVCHGFLLHSLCSALRVVGCPFPKCWLQKATFFWELMNRIHRDRYLEKEPPSCQSIENNMVLRTTAPEHLSEQYLGSWTNNKSSKCLYLNGTKFH